MHGEPIRSLGLSQIMLLGQQRRSVFELVGEPRGENLLV